MGLNIRIHDINVPSSFELFYKTGNTPGNMTVIENGYTQFGGIYPSSNSRNYNNDPIVFTGATFDTQYWFKIQYTGVTGQENSVGYIIENIKTHQPVGHIYYALHCCDFSGGVAAFYTGCTFSGGTVVYGSSLDPTPMPTPAPTATTPPATPAPTPNATPNPTPDATPAPTATIPGATPAPTATTPPATPEPTPEPTAGPTPGPTPDATPNPTPDPTSFPGTCYELIIPNTLLSQDGQTLYINYRKTDNTFVSWPYNQYQDNGGNEGSYTIDICSKTLPSTQYGSSGSPSLIDASITLNTGGGCTTSSDCGGYDPLPPPPTATAEVILNANGLCYRWSVEDGNNNSGTTVTYTPLHLNSSVTFNVNNVESDTQYYYICTKTTPNFVAGNNMIFFPSIQDGACALVDGVYSGCQAPLPDPTPGPTPGPTACPADGTFISSTCDGTTLITTYADGNCGTRTESTENDSGCIGGGGSGGGY